LAISVTLFSKFTSFASIAYDPSLCCGPSVFCTWSLFGVLA
jgi:hypothetical protein